MNFTSTTGNSIGGGFKINISKYGTEYSWGIPNFVLGNSTKENFDKTSWFFKQDSNGEYYNQSNINNKRNVSYSELLTCINQINQYNSTRKIILIIAFCSFLFSIFIEKYFLSISGLILCLAIWATHPIAKINIIYTIDDNLLNSYYDKMSKLYNLNKCHGKWQVLQVNRVTIPELKYNAGAKRILTRGPLEVLRNSHSYIYTNIPQIQIKLKNETLLFLPDNILLLTNSSVSCFNYSDLSFKVEDTEYIEYNKVPIDAKILAHTWEYVNIDGSPDRRFKNNRNLPICLYHYIHINSNTGYNRTLLCSNRIFADEFVNIMN